MDYSNGKAEYATGRHQLAGGYHGLPDPFSFKSFFRFVSSLFTFPSLPAFPGLDWGWASLDGLVKLILVVARYRTVRYGRTVQHSYFDSSATVILDRSSILLDRRIPRSTMRIDSFQTTLITCKCLAAEPSPYPTSIIVPFTKRIVYRVRSVPPDRQQHASRFDESVHRFC
jgi:hypothetical protein